ncbi:MAG: Fe-S cluster assembly protein SufD [Myxococcota bacterium]
MLSSFEASHDAYLPSAQESGWLRDLRRRSLDQFKALGFPNKKVEAWKYSSTAKIARTPFIHDSGALFEALAGTVVGSHSLRGAAAELVFVNGSYAAGLSRIADLPEGIEVTALATALNEQDWSERLDPAGWSPFPDASRNPGPMQGMLHDRAFDALNTAFLQDGIVLRVRRGVTLKAPIHVLLITVGESAPVASHPRLIIDVERTAQVTVVERHLATGSEPTLANTITDAHLADGAQLTHHLWRLGSNAAHHVGHVRVEVGRDARYVSHTAWLGAGFSRNDLDVRFVAPGGEALCTGVIVGTESEHIDNHTWMRHEAPQCTSREAYKGVYGGKSRGVFNGMVYIAPDAQQTDAGLSNQNLLLSDRAQVQTKPELQIHADDVKAAHGCTIGQLDLGALTYLRTRGIREAKARRMLTEGFVLDLLQEISDETLRDETTRLVRDRLARVAT